MNTSLMIRLLQFVLLGFGIKELYAATEYRKQQKEKLAFASMCMGIFACACSIISMTGIL